MPLQYLPTQFYELHFERKDSARFRPAGKQRHSSSSQHTVPSWQNRHTPQCHCNKAPGPGWMEQGASTTAPSCPLANSNQWSPDSQCKSETNLSGLYFGLKQVFVCLAISRGRLFCNTRLKRKVFCQKICSIIKIHLTNQAVWANNFSGPYVWRTLHLFLTLDPHITTFFLLTKESRTKILL